MTYQIRLMEEQDAQALFEIGKKCNLSSWSLESYINEYKNSIARYLVLLGESQVIGYAGMWCVVDEAQIMNVGVLEEYRSQGLGCRLMEAMIELAKKEACTSMTLEVKENNTPAIGLYKKMGFKAIAIRENYYPDHVNGLFMRRCGLG
ncbi:MAG: ribosomal protein S18-alanine N-acetyltransferase [Eubacterium sp.]